MGTLDNASQQLCVRGLPWMFRPGSSAPASLLATTFSRITDVACCIRGCCKQPVRTRLKTTSDRTYRMPCKVGVGGWIGAQSFRLANRNRFGFYGLTGVLTGRLGITLQTESRSFLRNSAFLEAFTYVASFCRCGSNPLAPTSLFVQHFSLLAFYLDARPHVGFRQRFRVECQKASPTALVNRS